MLVIQRNDKRGDDDRPIHPTAIKYPKNNPYRYVPQKIGRPPDGLSHVV
jgi:hypothetical protein